jgi:DNA invertase Pin-like site-specific DNA recombinase
MVTRAYIRVSTAEQARDGHSLAAQQAELERHAMARGWTIDEFYVDEGVSSGKRRPELERAMKDCKRGDRLLVTRLDRVCRSTAEYCRHAEKAKNQRWDLVMLDQPDLDMSTAGGRAMAQMLAVFAEFERSMIRQRTREGLKAAGAAGKINLVPDDVRERIAHMSDVMRMSEYRIADALTESGVPTPNGGERWARSTVQRVLASA